MSNHKKKKILNGALAELEHVASPADIRVPDRILIGADKQIRKQLKNLGLSKANLGEPLAAAAVADHACFVCLMPTDTMIRMWGCAELHVAACQLMGILPEHAWEFIRGEPDGKNWRVITGKGEVPSGLLLRLYQVCARCAARAHMTATLPQAPAGTYLEPGRMDPLAAVVPPDAGTWLSPGVRLIESDDYGAYLLPPVIMSPDGDAISWQPSMNILQLVACGAAPDVPVETMDENAASEYQRELIALSNEMRVPVWPFTQPGYAGLDCPAHD